MRATDLGIPTWDRIAPGEPNDYWQADLTDAGSAYALARGCDVVVHTAAIPQPIHNPPHVVFGNNMLSTFNTLEAAIVAGARRFVNFSSETVPGFIFAQRPFEPDYLPVDEEHPVRPQDPYATAKWFGELLCDRAVERSDMRCTSIRPCWVQDEGSYERNLGPIVRDPSVLIENYCSYVDVYDLCDAVVLVIETDLPGHEVFYIASPDTIGGHPLVETVTTHYGAKTIEFRPLDREDASAISTAKAERMLGWTPTSIVARLPRRRRAVAHMKTAAPRHAPARRSRGWASAPGRSGGRGASAGARWTTTNRSPRSGTPSSSGSTGSTPPPCTDSAIRRRSSDARSPPTASARTYSSSRSADGAGRARPDGVIENDLRPESIREECERSLRRLGVERIDLYQFHWPDWMTGTELEDSWAAMVELVEQGKARWIGVANFDVDQLGRCEALSHVASVQPPLSLLTRGARTTVLPWAAEQGTGAIVYSPMASGLLTGSFDRDRIAQLDTSDWRRGSPQFSEPALGRNLDLVERLRPIAAALGATLPELSVAWALAQTGVTAAIVGRPAPAPRRRLGGRTRARAVARRADRDRSSRGGERRRNRRSPAATPACAGGRRTANGGRMRLGLLSTADINRKVIPGARASEKVDLVAVASRDQARAEAYAKQWEIERAYGSYEALLDDPDIDAVYISLPNTMHREWSIRSRRGGQARHLREAVQQAAGGRRGRVRRRRADGPPPHRGIHVPAQPADREARRARQGAAPSASSASSARRSATRSTTRRTSAFAPTSTAAASWTSAATA